MMHPPVDTFEHAGLTVKILWEEYDQEIANPRDCSNLGVMFCDYRGYTLGDGDAPDPRGHAITCPDCGGEGEVEVPDTPILGLPDPLPTGTHPELCSACGGSGEIEESIVAYLKREHGARVILPLFVYEHSGITISCGGRLDTGEDNFNRHGRYAMDPGAWDTSSVGVIFDTTETRKDWSEDYLADDEKIEEILREEVEYYAAYLEGSVYGFAIEDADGEVLDSCGGFLELDVWSDDAGVREQAKAMAEFHRGQLDAEAAEAFRWACADVVTV